MKELTRDEVWKVMARVGIVKTMVEFSGGHDQGGVDSISVIRTGDTEGTLAPWYRQSKWENGQWVPFGPPPTDEQALAEAFAAPVYAQYESFAGEFYVNGTVTWDLSDKSVKMEKEESFERWERSEDYV